MPTDRELREISKKAMAKNREEKAKIKELKEKGLCVYEGEVIPVMEARKCGGQKGVKFGVQGAKFEIEFESINQFTNVCFRSTHFGSVNLIVISHVWLIHP